MGGIVDSIFGGGGKKAGNKAAAYSKENYQTGLAALIPYSQGGAGAFGMMGNMLGLNGADAQTDGFKNYMDSTGYKFLLDSGSKAVTGNMGAKGLLNSGATLKALEQFGQNLASTKTSEYMQQLGNMANVGAGAAGNIMGGGQQAAQNYGQNKMAAAQSQADAWGSVANLGMSIASLSDERAKTFMLKVGELANGVGLYLYHYLTGGPLQWGVSAQEVRRLQPAAAGPIRDDGFLTVNYFNLEG